MITIKIEDAAGATKGRPTYPIDVWTRESGPEQSAVVGEVRRGTFEGDFLREQIGGTFEIYTPPYPAEVTSYSIFHGRTFGQAQSGRTLLYTETYDRPLKMRGGSIEDALARADRFAERGIDFEGNVFSNRYQGKGGNDALAGLGGADRLGGGAGRDALDGGFGRDRLDGGAGRDRLTGGGGDDRFVFGSAAEAGHPDRPDRITDFASGDRIDLTAIDARAGSAADNAFRFIGAEDFDGRIGQLRYADGLLLGDTDGDGAADFAIALANDFALTRADLLL
jgi:hypothetical protein